MPFTLEWPRVVALIAAVVILAVAAFVFAVRPSDRPNRQLALVLSAEAVGMGAGWSLAQMATEESLASGLTTLAWAAYAAQIPLYLLFLATLRTRAVKWLAVRPVRLLLWSLALAGPVLVLARPDLFFTGFTVRPGAGTFIQVPGPLGMIVPAIHSLPLPLFALAAAIFQWRAAARESALKRQASAFAFAFGFRELSWIFLLGALPVLTGTSVTDSDLLPTLLYGLLGLVFVSILVYGILFVQLFDIDAKARLVIRGSTIAGFAGILYFLITHIAEYFVGAEGLLSSIIAGVIIAVAFKPLHLLGRWAARRLVPVRDAGHEERHRIELYESAVASFMQDGEITPREAAALERLRSRLRLPDGLALGGEASVPDNRAPMGENRDQDD